MLIRGAKVGYSVHLGFDSEHFLDFRPIVLCSHASLPWGDQGHQKAAQAIDIDCARGRGRGTSDHRRRLARSMRNDDTRQPLHLLVAKGELRRNTRLYRHGARCAQPL